MSGHRVLHDLYKAPFLILDPGDAGSIIVDRYGAVCPLVSGAAGETRTLPVPTKAGLQCTLVLDTDGGGDVTLTVTSGYNFDGDTSIVFGDAGDYVVFQSVKIGANYRWRAIAQEGTTAAVETLDVDSLSIGGTAVTSTAAELNILDGVTSTAAELNQLDGNIIDDMATTAGVGITGTADNFASSVTKVGTLFKTTIVIDIDGLNAGGTAGDIIGANGAGVAHLGQITAARSGTIFAGRLTCVEAPTGGDTDIDIYSATENTGVEDVAISTLAETQLCNSGVLSAGTVVPLTSYPAADEYLYLVGQAGGDATYTAGILEIELWGK
jgi:hypothetical protein